jgi:ribonuclease HI
VQENVVRGGLTQEDNGKEFVVAYVSQRLLDVETRYESIEKLCLSLYYACIKFRHYILSSTCTMLSHYDVVKYMLQKPILSGRMGKWAYSLIEYDLKYDPLQTTKGQVVADYVVDHMAITDNNACLVEVAPWKLFFDGSMCSRGQGVGCVLVSPNGAYHEFAVKLGFACMNDQAEYEDLLHGLELLKEMGVKEIEVLGDSNLVVQQIRGESQCLDGKLNRYRNQCLDIIQSLNSFQISHIPREDN